MSNPKIVVHSTGAYGWGAGHFNYCAYDDNTYDGPGSLIGYGATPDLAKEDLLEQATNERCENCGIPIGNKPEDATCEEMLCDKCYEMLDKPKR